ncbi:hypothetical protein H6504_04950 [Candidatus Woesearchaeota archaeon]|nr:hypothetical protein [Candidatus Woesearchaeota archaeon]
MSKKASLQLSINAIVVLILAITLLGLGLGFVKTLFGSTTENFENMNQELKTDMIEQLEQSGSLMTLKQTKFEVESGKPVNFYYGLRNTESVGQCFYVQFYCNQALSVGVPGDCLGQDITNADYWFWFKTVPFIHIPAQTSMPLYATLQASGATDTYDGRLIIWKAPESAPGECASGGFTSGFDFQGSEASSIYPGGSDPSAEINTVSAYADIDGNPLTFHAQQAFYVSVK